jgi:hypothetical protein
MAVNQQIPPILILSKYQKLFQRNPLRSSKNMLQIKALHLADKTIKQRIG